MAEPEQRLYRLRIVDIYGSVYVVLGPRQEMQEALDWMETDVGARWLKLHGFDDDVSRRPITVLVSRESIAGMLLGRA